MDRLVGIFSGGIVSEKGQFVRMRQQIVRFNRPPAFADLISRVYELFRVERGQCDICLRGRFDAGGKRAHYAILPFAKCNYHYQKNHCI